MLCVWCLVIFGLLGGWYDWLVYSLLTVLVGFTAGVLRLWVCSLGLGCYFGLLLLVIVVSW